MAGKSSESIRNKFEHGDTEITEKHRENFEDIILKAKLCGLRASVVNKNTETRRSLRNTEKILIMKVKRNETPWSPCLRGKNKPEVH